MAKYKITGPDGASYVVNAPDDASEADVMAYAQKNFGASQPKEQPVEDLPSVFQQFPELNNKGGMAATLGASDAQLGDAYQKALGDRFIRREAIPGGYEVMVTRGADGKEQRGYVNKPGLDTEDVVRAVRGSLPYMLTGGAAGAATRGAGLIANAVGQGVASAATSAAGDVAQMPLGSQQGVEGGKAAAMGLFGLGAPIVARGLGNAAATVKEAFAPRGGALAGMSGRAVKNVAESMAADPTITRANAGRMAADYGPELMLGDMGATLQGDTAALARTPLAKDVAANALRNRQNYAAQRINSSITQAMGPERNLPQYMAQQKAGYSAQAKPYYDQFYQSSIIPTKNLKETLRRIPSAAYSDAEKLAKADGVKQKFALKPANDPMTPMTGVQKMQAERVIKGQEYDYLKRAVDDMAKAAEPGSNQQRIYANLARDLRNEVDSILSPSDPSQSPWALARSLAGEGIEGKEAADLGSKVFTSRADPHAVQADLSQMSAFGKDMYREGARNNLRGIMGRSATNYGARGDSAARRALNSEFSRENIDAIVGQQNSRNLINRIDAENHMAQTHDLALGNSVTDTMQQARKRWAPHASSNFAAEAGKKGPLGVATEAVFKVADAMVSGVMSKAEARAAIDGAKILTAQGPARDRIVRELFNYIDARNAGRLSGQKFEKVVRALLETSRVPAVSYQTH